MHSAIIFHLAGRLRELIIIISMKIVLSMILHLGGGRQELIIIIKSFLNLP